MRRPAALAAVLLALVTSQPAHAHAATRLKVASPSEGSRVSGERIKVVLEGEGGNSAVAFRLDLDGQPVDATGRVGGLFTSLSVLPEKKLVLHVPMALGEHTLTATPDVDPDAPQAPVVRRFTVVVEEPGNPAVALGLAGVAIAGALGAAYLVRRKTAA